MSDAPKIETLTCQNGPHEWERVVTRARKPRYCPKCVNLPDVRLRVRLERAAKRMGEVPIHVKTAVKDEAAVITADYIVEQAEPETAQPVRHRAFENLMTVVEAGVPAMLVGPAGSGKSTAGRHAAHDLQLPFYTESCNPLMTKYDLLGFKTADGTYTPGVVYAPFKEGGVLLLDEMDASNPALLVTINLIASVEVGEEVTFPNGENVPRHPSFVLIAGCNTFGDGASAEYVGREQLDAATLDRFATIKWEYDPALEKQAADRPDWVKHVQTIRQIVKEQHLPLLVTPRASILGARLMAAGLSWRETEEMILFKGASDDVRSTVMKELKKLESKKQTSSTYPPFPTDAYPSTSDLLTHIV